jgi:predicted RNA-binding protein YlqC (UPF0109 family)
MIEEFIKSYAKLIVSNPDDITVSKTDLDNNFSEIVINAKKVDAGKLIGRDGKMITSIKTLINGCKAKEDRTYKVLVKVIDE